jgi:hypothetical protein
MANNLFHEKAREALKKHLENILSTCVLDKGIINFDKGKDGDLYKFINEAKKHRNIWMRDIDFYSLLYQELSNYLTKQVEKRWEATGNLKDFIEDKGIGEIINAIIAHLETIPRKYRIYFELPSVKGIGVKEIKLTDDIAFIERINESDFEKVKIPSKSLLGGNYSYTLQREKLYICVQVDGYADGTLECSAFKKAYSKFKQVILVGKLSGVFVDKQPTISAGLLSFGMPHVFVINALDSSDEKYQVTLPKSVFDYISKIELNENALKPTQIENLVETFEDKETLTPNDKAKLLKNRFQYPIKLLKTSDNNKDSEAIKTAIEWAFDSLTNDNDTLAFIQACIGIEAVIGDDNKENITATLADRCAYLLGDSISARKTIRENFEQLYNIRSKVVHGRKAYLDNEQRYFLDYAQRMLKKVIWKEISFIKSENRS